MADIVLLLITVGFFALAALLVRACDAIIGPESADADLTDGAPELDAATADELLR
jgi:hypothetical protein